MATKTETDRTWQRRWLCQLEPYDVVAKLQSNQHHQHTNILYFHTPDALPVAQPTASKHWRHQQGKEQPSDTWTSRIRKSNHPGFCCSKRWWRWWWWQTELNDVQSSSQIKSTLKTIPTFGTSVGRMPFLLCNQWCQSTEGIDRTHSHPTAVIQRWIIIQNHDWHSIWLTAACNVERWHTILKLREVIWNHFCLDHLFVCDNVHTDYVSVLVYIAVCTIYYALQIIIFTLHYIPHAKFCISWIIWCSGIAVKWSF